MTPGDVETAEAVWQATLPARSDNRERWRHLLATDPDGAFIAADGSGFAMALCREDFWFLSALAVSEQSRRRGLGRALLDATLAYGSDAPRAMISASDHPAAARLYFEAGFDLHPGQATVGVPRRETIPSGLRTFETVIRPEWTDDLVRVIRDGPSGADVDMLMRTGNRLIVLDQPDAVGFALHDAGQPRLIAANTSTASRELLWGCLRAAPPGKTVQLLRLTSGHQWAMDVCLAAGLDLVPGMPVFTRGMRPPEAYLPSGPFG